MHDSKSDIYFLVFASILLFFSLVFFIFVFFRHYRSKQRGNFSEKEAMKNSFQQELLRSQLEIQERTLQNISQEIHDNIGQVLSLAKLNLATADINQTEQLRQKIDDSRNLVGKAIQDLRDLSKSMNTDYVAEMGLSRSIEYELEMIKKTGSFETVFEIEGSLYPFDRQKELILFRIVQEVLNNIIKHAHATRIAVKLDYQPGFLSLNVLDNGQGFDPGHAREPPDDQKTSPGLGIKNMQNRALLIGANFSISSSQSWGTSVHIYLPGPI
jgi:two-component system, NarL family, sensor kinase